MKYLLAVTLGPVQSYIEESEKFIGLRNGSQIISDLMKNIIEYIFDKDEGSQIIYPKYDKPIDINSINDCTNYLVFEVTEKDKLELKSLEDKIYKNMGGNPENFKETFFLFWAIEELKSDEDYSTIYSKLQRLMNGIKHTYIFNNEEKFQEGNFGNDKCHICGKRSIYKNDLCPLCIYKREYNKKYNESNYESNYSIAIKCWKAKYKGNIKAVDKLFKEIFKKGHEDGYYSLSQLENTIFMLKKGDIKNKRFKDFLYDLKQESAEKLEKLTKKKENRLLSKELETIQQDLRSIQQDLKKLYKNENKDLNISEPNYEYGFIQFDIDSLGDWMHGKFLDEDMQKNLKAYQEKISGLLISFGRELRKELEHECDIIYSGGDDFLAMMPIEKIQFVLDKIKKLFEKNVGMKLQVIGISKEMTHSTCITIAPCKVPIGEVLSKSRLELNKVKEKYEKNNKNGIAFNYIVGDGAAVTAYMKKDNFDGFLKLIEYYKEIKDIFPLSFIKKYQKEFINFPYEEITNQNFRDLRSMNKIELKRIMKKSKLVKEDKGTEQKEIAIQKYMNEMIKFMDSLFYKNCVPISANRENVDFENYSNIIDIYERLCRLQGFYKCIGGDVNETTEIKTV